jgi:hypothetical protein
MNAGKQMARNHEVLSSLRNRGEGLQPKRLEHWVKLLAFTHDLPDDYSYAVHIKERRLGVFCRALVRVGDRFWFGSGRGENRNESLAAALRVGLRPLRQGGLAGIIRWGGGWARRLLRWSWAH